MALSMNKWQDRNLLTISVITNFIKFTHTLVSLLLIYNENTGRFKMSKSKRPDSNDKKRSKGTDSGSYPDSDSRNIWEDEIERELNSILEKAKCADHDEYHNQFECDISDCVSWGKSLHLQAEDIRIIDCLWQMSLEGIYSERTIKLLKRVFDTPREALSQLKRIHILLQLGILVGEPHSGLGNRYMPFFWEANERKIFHIHLGLSSEALAYLQGQTTKFSPYFGNGFRNSDEHLKAWFQVWEAAWAQFCYQGGCSSIEANWKPETDPAVLAMLQHLHGKEARTKSKLKFRELCQKYSLSDPEILLLVLHLHNELEDSNGLEEMLSSIDNSPFNSKLLMHEALIRKFRKSNLHKHKLLKIDQDTPEGFCRLPITKFELSPNVLAELYSSGRSAAKAKPRSDKEILFDYCAQNNLVELDVSTKNLSDLILSSELNRSLTCLISSSRQSVCRKLSSWGLKGYTGKNAQRGSLALFWGRPGTGKTLAAQAIAGQLGKAILKTNSSHILSKWFGETEKKAQRLISGYFNLCDDMQNPPILLFNEADQLFTKRSKDPDGSADQAWNATQNIFLEAMENPKGMIIATTNLLPCMDEAYSRRFDAVLEFKFPCQRERQQLWNLLLPKRVPGRNTLDLDEVSTIPLSGGQIEKVIRNVLISMASDPSTPNRISTALLIRFCEKELSQSFENSPNYRKPIGFAHKKEQT